VSYRVCLVALVIVLALFLFGVAGNEILVSSEELTSLAAMAPPWSASAQASALPPFIQIRTICFQQPRLHTPSGLRNRSTVDHGRGPRAPWWTELIPARHVAPLSVSDAVSRGPLEILHFNPPVSSKSTRSPT